MTDTETVTARAQLAEKAGAMGVVVAGLPAAGETGGDSGSAEGEYAECGDGLVLDDLDLLGFRPEWQPQTEADVESVLGRRADNLARIARVRANAAAEIRRLERQNDALLGRYGAALEAYTRRVLRGGKTQTVATLHGKLGFTRRPARIKVDADDGALVAWAKVSAPGRVRTVTTESVSRAELVKGLVIAPERTDESTGGVVPARVIDRETGEVVPVAVVVPAGERFSIDGQGVKGG